MSAQLVYFIIIITFSILLKFAKNNNNQKLNSAVFMVAVIR